MDPGELHGGGGTSSSAVTTLRELVDRLVTENGSQPGGCSQLQFARTASDIIILTQRVLSQSGRTHASDANQPITCEAVQDVAHTLHTFKRQASYPFSVRVWETCIEKNEFESANSQYWPNVYPVRANKIELMHFVVECHLRMVLLNFLGAAPQCVRQACASDTAGATDVYAILHPLLDREWDPAKLRDHLRAMSTGGGSPHARWAQTAHMVTYGDRDFQKWLFDGEETNVFINGKPTHALLEVFQRADLLAGARHELAVWTSRLPVSQAAIDAIGPDAPDIETDRSPIEAWIAVYSKRQFGDDAIRDAREWLVACRLLPHEPHSILQPTDGGMGNTQLAGTGVIRYHRPLEMEAEFAECGVTIRRSIEERDRDSSIYQSALLYLFVYALRQNHEYDLFAGFYGTDNQPMHAIMSIKHYRDSLLRTPPPLFLQIDGGVLLLVKEDGGLSRFPEKVSTIQQGIAQWSRYVLKKLTGNLSWGKTGVSTLATLAPPREGDDWSPIVIDHGIETDGIAAVTIES